jgi:dihydroxyacetone kinase-like predicted kinase
MFNVEASPEENFEEMKAALTNVKSGEETFAIRDSEINGVKVKKDDYIGISGKDIAVASRDMMQTTKELLKVLANEDSSFVTLIYGSDVSTKQAEEIRGFIEDSLDMDCELVNGHQELYPFIIGVE